MYRQSEKNLLSSNISSTCPHNMVNFGPLAAEIVLLVWRTPPNFNGFGVLAALLHGILVDHNSANLLSSLTVRNKFCLCLCPDEVPTAYNAFYIFLHT